MFWFKKITESIKLLTARKSYKYFSNIYVCIVLLDILIIFYI